MATSHSRNLPSLKSRTPEQTMLNSRILHQLKLHHRRSRKDIRRQTAQRLHNTTLLQSLIRTQTESTTNLTYTRTSIPSKNLIVGSTTPRRNRPQNSTNNQENCKIIKMYSTFLTIHSSRLRRTQYNSILNTH